MKICLLGENGSVHVQKWIKAIAAYEQIDLHVITFDRGVKFDNVTYYPIKKITGTKLDFFLNAGRVKRLVRKIAPDVLHGHYATSYGFLSAYSGFHPLIITGWGADIFDSPNSPVMKKILQNSMKKADALTVLSKVTQQEMKKLTDKKVELIPFGVDLHKFKPAAEKPESEVIRIGTIRTLAEKYGLEYLIRAFALLAPKYKNIHLDIVGDGPQRAFLQELTIDLNVESKVTFHGYVNQNSDFKSYIKLLNSFDIFTILSVLDSETFGVAAVEASACKLPVVASNVGGLPEVIDDEQTGIIVPPRDPAQTAAALERLINDRQLRLTMGENGRRKVETYYNWENNVQQMVDLYQKMADGKA